MKISKVPFWLIDNFEIIGAEDEENSSGGNEGGNEGGDGAGGDGGNSSGDGNDGGDSGGAGSKEAILGDLAKERRERQKAERELAAFKKKEQEAADKEKTESERLSGELQKKDERLNKLNAGFVRARLDTAIEKMARELKFKDTDDALVMVDRSLIEYEQDEDDPSKVTIKETTVKAAVKKVAEKKPHLLTTGTNDGQPSGSGFGGNGNNGRGNNQTEEEALASRYPSLGR